MPYTWTENTWWSIPDRLGAIDLRTLPQMRLRGGAPQGYAWAIFDAPSTNPDAISLGDSLGPVRDFLKRTIENALGLGERLVANTLSGILWEVLTTQSDPLGLGRTKTLLPTRALRLRVACTGMDLGMRRVIPEVSAEWPGILAVLQGDYSLTRREVLAGRLPEDHHLKVLGGLARQYRLDYREFLGNEPDEGVLRPQTTLSETWPGADDTGGINGDLNWTLVLGNWDKLSNVASLRDNNAAFNTARCDSVLSSTNQRVDIDVVALTPPSAGAILGGPAARYASGAETYYIAALGDSAGGGSGGVRFWKVITGTATELDSNRSVTISLPDTMRIDVDGSVMRSYLNGGLEHDFTDSSITTGTQGGITGRIVAGGAAGDYECDNWLANDVVSLYPPQRQNTLVRM